MLPPIIDYAELVPEQMQATFREEFRAMHAEKAAAAEQQQQHYAQPAQQLPLSEVHNLRGERALTPSSHASRPLTGPSTGHANPAMHQPNEGEAPQARPWSKKGRRGAPDGSRAARSEIGDVFSWQ